MARRLTARRALTYCFGAGLLALGAPFGWLLLRLTAGQVEQGIFRELSDNAAVYAYLLLGTAIAFCSFALALGLRADRLVRTNRRLAKLAITDALTRLRNARYFHERLGAECSRADREGTRLSLVMFDLDHFKRINDVHGHSTGDVVLAHVARVLRQHKRKADEACRIGGEEFALLCPATSVDEAARIADRIRAALEANPPAHGGAAVPVTLSAGVAERLPGAGSADALFSAADQALYCAKRAGRNRVERFLPLPAGAALAAIAGALH